MSKADPGTVRMQYIRRIEKRIIGGYEFVANFIYYYERGNSFGVAVALARNTL